MGFLGLLKNLIALLPPHDMLFHQRIRMPLLHGNLLMLVMVTRVSTFPWVCSLGPDVSQRTKNVFDVLHYGAKANGNADDSQAFSGAWDAACASSKPSVIYIPNGKYFLNPIFFKGPCASQSITVQVAGNLVAPGTHSLWNKQALDYWLHFKDVNGLTVEGLGSLDGRGKPWWDQSCRVNKQNPCREGPASLKFSRCTDITLRNVTSTNSKQIHVNFDSCNGVKAYGLNILAPANSPNTDGIHIQHSKNVTIQDIAVGTGDDCISIGSGSANVYIQGVTCGPGHGISVGSLGEHNQEASVSNITVEDVRLVNTQNGLRIKTWQGGKGLATDLAFYNVEMRNVMNPIFIDQYYCPHSTHCPNQTNAVQIRKVSYKNIYGTSATKVAIQISCSDRVPCLDISLENVQLMYVNGDHPNMREDNGVSVCNNVQGTSIGMVHPPSCLLHSN